MEEAWRTYYLKNRNSDWFRERRRLACQRWRKTQKYADSREKRLLNCRERYKNLSKEEKDRLRVERTNQDRELRARVLELLGNKCAQCGFSDPRALQIDHRNGGGSAEKKKLGHVRRIYKIVLKHPENYQCLCANCNWIKRTNNGEIN